MKCEGDRVYDEPGDCPVCNMHLVAVGVDDEDTSTSSDNHQHVQYKGHHKHDTGSADRYYCTMGCEGDKTYNHPGECPVCGMHLKLISSI